MTFFRSQLYFGAPYGRIAVVPPRSSCSVDRCRAEYGTLPPVMIMLLRTKHVYQAVGRSLTAVRQVGWNIIC